MISFTRRETPKVHDSMGTSIPRPHRASHLPVRFLDMRQHTMSVLCAAMITTLCAAACSSNGSSSPASVVVDPSPASCGQDQGAGFTVHKHLNAEIDVVPDEYRGDPAHQLYITPTAVEQVEPTPGYPLSEAAGTRWYGVAFDIAAIDNADAGDQTLLADLLVRTIEGCFAAIDFSSIEPTTAPQAVDPARTQNRIVDGTFPVLPLGHMETGQEEVVFSVPAVPTELIWYNPNFGTEQAIWSLT